jgi:hypothetical protein
MWKPSARLLLVGSLAILLGSAAAAEQPQFEVCESTYALCTTAPCQPIAGQEDTASCACDVKTGYSLGLKPCQAAVETSQGEQIQSRYFPIKSYAICTKDRPWANCLDSPCVIDKSDPSKAACACAVAKDQGPYVMVTDVYDDSTCTTGLWSSATVIDANRVTDFLMTNSELKPFDVKVLNSPK